MNYLWVEKYRPKTVDECIFPPALAETFKSFLAKKDFPNLLLVGPPGTGKTTVAKALCAELDYSFFYVNGSDEGRFLDTIRTNVAEFINSGSFESDKKVILIDEADNTTYDVQCCLRAFIEKYSEDCRFILTANYSNKVIPALHSRCSVLDFNSSGCKKQLGIKFLNIMGQVLFLENVKASQRDILSYIVEFYPDWRKTINKIQSSVVNDQLPPINMNLKDISVDSLETYIRNKDFSSIREWVKRYIHVEDTVVLKKIYDYLASKDLYVKRSNFPDMIITICKYMEFSSKVADKEINLVSCILELMILYHESH